MNSTGPFIAYMNDTVVIPALIIERKTKFISKSSRKPTYLPIYLLIFFFHVFLEQKYLAFHCNIEF